MPNAVTIQYNNEGVILKDTAMPAYKHRTIKLTPKRTGDGTWSCAYRIIEIRSTGWRFHKGHSYGSFGSRDEAETAAFEEAKQIVDALELVGHHSWSTPSTAFRNYGNKLRKFLAWS